MALFSSVARSFQRYRYMRTRTSTMLSGYTSPTLRAHPTTRADHSASTLRAVAPCIIRSLSCMCSARPAPANSKASSAGTNCADSSQALTPQLPTRLTFLGTARKTNTSLLMNLCPAAKETPARHARITPHASSTGIDKSCCRSLTMPTHGSHLTMRESWPSGLSRVPTTAESLSTSVFSDRAG